MLPLEYLTLVFVVSNILFIVLLILVIMAITLKRGYVYIKNDISYADDTRQPIKVRTVRALEDYFLKLVFFTGETKIVDFKPFLKYPAFITLSDKQVFDSVYIEHGYVAWNDGEIDIAPEKLFEIGVDYHETKSA